MLTSSHLEFLFTSNGLVALREDLITIDKIAALTDMGLAELRDEHSHQLDCYSTSYKSM
ncbi:hypothetical protein [Legionella tunisiensis]|uniref:hypothetical protein n=1 Tax=Legionella tunisiensis TaxID=1034944 RepID=UPI0002FDF816|nr:hypothetical protein [Legionella tunisiensis]